ncbi:MAG: molybdopterin-dependent oxidoreductase, partial [Slackia sp.]|nr:molybdopterin-dependent oxidoreductase [Slackia sp.]
MTPFGHLRLAARPPIPNSGLPATHEPIRDVTVQHIEVSRVVHVFAVHAEWKPETHCMLDLVHDSAGNPFGIIAIRAENAVCSRWGTRDAFARMAKPCQRTPDPLDHGPPLLRSLPILSHRTSPPCPLKRRLILDHSSSNGNALFLCSRLSFSDTDKSCLIPCSSFPDRSMRRPLRNHTPIRTIFHIEIIFDETKGDVMDVSTSMPKSKGSHTRRQAHGVSRRNFVKTGAAVGMAASLAGMAGCTFDKGSDGAESHEQSVDPWADCEEFFAACPPECQHHNLRALVRNGKVVKVDCGASNESKPCMMGMSRIGWLNSPDRLTMPLLRDGEKGENAWKEISWDEAFDLIAEKLEDAIDTIGNQAIVIDGHAGNFNAIPGSAMSAFVARLGGTMTLSGSLCCAAMNESTKVSFGKRFMDLRNQFENADYMLVWGNNP